MDDDTSISLQMQPKDVIEVELTSTEKPEPKVNIKLLEMDWASDEDIENEPSPAEMLQIDGNGDLSSSSSDEFDYGYSVAPKRRKIEAPESNDSSFSDDTNLSPSENSMSTDVSQDSCSDLGLEGDQSDENSNEVSLDVEEFHVERGSLDEYLDNLPSAMVSEDELGRPHIKCPTSGPSYIFFKSCRTKGASISRHCNDILNIAEVSFN